MYAQQDSTAKKKDSIPLSAQARPAYVRQDSAAIAREAREQLIADSIGMALFRPDSLRENQFLKALFKNPFGGIDSLFTGKGRPLVHKDMNRGTLRTFRSHWVLITAIGLLIYTALLNIFLGNDLKSVLRSFYSKQVVGQADKEGGLISFWAFMGLFVLFSLCSGLFLYQLMAYNNVGDIGIGKEFWLFINLSIIISLLFALKFLVLKFLGFVFNAGKVVSTYVGILNLTYFNFAFLFLAVSVCFSLLSGIYVQDLLIFTLVAIAVIFAWQYLRNSVSIISNIRFPKFYLFVYLCALEICPILILIKALNI
ncbi:DUF4271 domain-containing protein [Mucilaginibacter sp. L3T2-6]|uniref:DUF4271 domain-containing protein n=1 Tax=Mucilaginibacter sp. L3T2-6 TaxID=3062491 RepID=UPI0026745FB9|nr:DUF4271 domain-containing protein [Mucilaginibacter sp. L3T2-6]MDO3640443.1 DUF4271 domain-containing protein [Mucilaginibacter sp. L3T2-6]MDV6213218.1 DUF4271 domain-containing protein [Mucilaginibacter sp. L3T2-6]